MLLFLDLLADDDDLVFLALAGDVEAVIVPGEAGCFWADGFWGEGVWDEGFWCIPLATTATDHAGQLFVFWHDGRLTVGQAVSPLHVLVEPPGLFSRHTQRGLASGELLRNVVSPDRSRRLDTRRPQHTTPIDAPAPRVVALDARRDVVLTPSIPPLIVVASAAGLVVAQRHNDLFILAEDSDSPTC